VNDYRPISLINYITKIITKILGNRLQKVIIPLIQQNQYGFIKSRTIQDCLTWAFEYIHQCHYSKRQIIILKLDFTKAFDTLEHAAIIQVMQHIGFSKKWLDWTQKILHTASIEVLLNGVSGKNINCKRG
jgi:retron-type reverse transcriptase